MAQIKLLMGLRDSITATNPAPVEGQLLFTKNKGGHIFFDTDGTEAGRIELYKDVIDNIEALTEQVGDESVAEQIQAAVEELKELIRDAKSAGTTAQSNVNALAARVGSIPENTTLVDMFNALENEVTGGTGNTDGQSLSEQIATNAAGIAQNAAAIAELKGDGEGSVKDIVAAEVARIVADSPTALEDLEQIAAWISDHPEDVADMNSQITNNKTAVDTLNGDENTEGSVSNSIKNALDGLDVISGGGPGKYVKSVSQADGRIAVEYDDLPSEGGASFEWGTF